MARSGLSSLLLSIASPNSQSGALGQVLTVANDRFPPGRVTTLMRFKNPGMCRVQILRVTLKPWLRLTAKSLCLWFSAQLSAHILSLVKVFQANMIYVVLL